MNMSFRNVVVETAVFMGLSSFASVSFGACALSDVTFSPAAVDCTVVTGSNGSGLEDAKNAGLFSSDAWEQLVGVGGDGGNTTTGQFAGLNWELVNPTNAGGTSGDFSLSITDDSTPGGGGNIELVVAIGTSNGLSYAAYLVSDPTALRSGVPLGAGSTVSGSWTTNGINSNNMDAFTVFARVVSTTTPRQLPEPGSLFLVAGAALVGFGLRRRGRA